MSTFTAEGDPKVKEVKVPPEDKPVNAFDDYIKQMNKEYADLCKKMAQETQYEILTRINGVDKPVKYRRQHLTQREIDDIEDIRIEASILSKQDGKEKEAKAKNREWYVAIGQGCLHNISENRPMNEDDYDNAVSNTLRAVLDGSIMAEMSGVPN